MNDGFLAQVQPLLADRTKAPDLDRLLQGEVARVVAAMVDEGFAPNASYSNDEFARRLGAYETLTEQLGRTCAALAYWYGDTDERMVPRVIARLSNSLERDAGQQPYLELMLYPAVLVLYSAGVAAVVGRREGFLADLLGLPVIRVRGEWKPAAQTLYAQAAIDHRIGQRIPGLERHHTPASDRVYQTIRPWLAEVEPDDVDCERAFDRWGYLFGLVSFDMTRGDGPSGWASVGRFSWRGGHGRAIEPDISREAIGAGAEWPLLKAGLFRKDPARLATSIEGWQETIQSIRRGQW
jgi:hypothetical protein